MKVKLKRLHPDAVIPTKAHPTDAGLDLTATSRYFDEHGCAVYGTGIAVEIPEGYVGLIFPRSSIAKYDLCLSNSVGCIDAGYRGEIMAKFKPTLAYVDNCLVKGAGKAQSATDYISSVQTDVKMQSVSACGLDSMFFGNMPHNQSGRATTEIDCKFYQTLDPRLYEVGDRIGQLIILPIPEIEFEEVAGLSDSDRGIGGYGSTGN